MNKYILRTKDITKKYQNSIAVDNVNISIKKGDIYGLIGKNGAGKTSIIKMITNLTPITNGVLELFGSNDLVSGRKKIGCIVETPALYGGLNAKQNLEYYRIQKGISDKTAINKCLQLVGLTDTENKKAKNFSLGMKQRLGLAIAMLGNPDFLILDEPINGLDPMGIVEMRNTIKKLNEELGITILISSHILTELSQTATKFGIINKGKLIKEITKQDLEESRCSITVKSADVKNAMKVLKEENIEIIKMSENREDLENYFKIVIEEADKC